MESDERDIFQYLKTWGQEFVGVREICRRAAPKKRSQGNPDWAVPYLQSMTERGVLERDALGRYRVKPKEKKSGGHWVSPEIEKILEEGGVKVENKASLAGADDILDPL